MDRRRFLKALGAGSLGLAASHLLRTGRAHATEGRAVKPNVVLILIDDLGCSDVGCYGSTFYETPNVDRLATQGMRFTDAYAACPVCSPTRASILTGKYPATVNLTDFIPGHWRPYAKLIVPKFNQQLPLGEVTIAEALKAAGYRTACFGKWHLGGRQFGPDKHGFDESGGAPNRNDKAVRGLTDRALDFIERHKDKPFFLFLSHHTVHIPIQASKERIEKYRKKLKPGQKFPQQDSPAYAAMVEEMDIQVGRVMARLDELKLADNTVLIFYSDNGGLHKIFTGKGNWTTSNAPLRNEKGSLYEGGIRVPLIVRWPGKVKPGTECSVPVTSVDLYPTFLEAAGSTGDPKHEVDGVSMAPLLTGKGNLDREAIYWHYPHYHHTAPCGAIRAGDHKLIEYYEDGTLELYNLKDDLGEKTNLAGMLEHEATQER
ncbi:sulfatase, partial [Planctomycetota bacterium]